jgi:hypothetical protein
MLSFKVDWLTEPDRTSLLETIREAEDKPRAWPSTELEKWHSESRPQSKLGMVPSLSHFTRSETFMLEFVMQLTLFTSEVYRQWLPAIPVTEWFILGYKAQDSYAVYMSVFNRLVVWAQESILDLGDAERLKLVEFWISVSSVIVSSLIRSPITQK